MSSKGEIVEQIDRLERLARMAEDSPLDKLQWNLKQWTVINSKEKSVYMSGPNQVGGKTTTANQVIKQFATNKFPPGYDGIRFNRPIYILALSVNTDKTQEVLANRLFGRFDNRGEGVIPSTWFDADQDLVPAPGGKRGQVAEAMLPCFGENGEILGRSRIKFMAYSMGDEALQGETPDLVVCDEEPYPSAVYKELEARLNFTRGYMRIFANPTRGNTECRKKHKSIDNPDYRYIEYGLDDCEHITDEHRAELERKYPPGSAERMLRLYGEVPEGEGIIFPVHPESLACEEQPIQPHHVACIGIDIPHTTNGASACALVSLSKQEDVVTVHASWKKLGATRSEFAEQLARLGGHKIDIAWPHDGNRGEHAGNRTIIQGYQRDFGLNFMAKQAQYRDGDKWSKAIKPVIDDVYDRMMTGRFQVVRGSSNRELFEELRGYHTKDGKVARRQDDHIIDAVWKAMMVLDRLKEYGAVVSGVGAPLLPKANRHKDFFTGRRSNRKTSWTR